MYMGFSPISPVFLPVMGNHRSTLPLFVLYTYIPLTYRIPHQVLLLSRDTNESWDIREYFLTIKTDLKTSHCPPLINVTKNDRVKAKGVIWALYGLYPRVLTHATNRSLDARQIQGAVHHGSPTNRLCSVNKNPLLLRCMLCHDDSKFICYHASNPCRKLLGLLVWRDCLDGQ